MLPTRCWQDTAPYVEISSFRHPMRIRYISVENPYQGDMVRYGTAYRRYGTAYRRYGTALASLCRTLARVFRPLTPISVSLPPSNVLVCMPCMWDCNDKQGNQRWQTSPAAPPGIYRNFIWGSELRHRSILETITHRPKCQIQKL